MILVFLHYRPVNRIIEDDHRGSFLDSETPNRKQPNKPLISYSAVDQSQLQTHNFGADVRKSQSEGLLQKDDESFASMVSWGGMPPYNG